MQMQITFKGGAQIVVDVDEFKVGRSRRTRELASLEWVTPEGAGSALHGVFDLGEVVAIVTLRAPDPGDT